MDKDIKRKPLSSTRIVKKHQRTSELQGAHPKAGNKATRKLNENDNSQNKDGKSLKSRSTSKVTKSKALQNLKRKQIELEPKESFVSRIKSRKNK